MATPRFAAVIALAVLAAAPLPALSLCIVTYSQPTWREDAADCTFLLYGELECARQQGDGGRTDLVIEHIFKCPPGFQNVKGLTIPRYIPTPDGKNPRNILVFGDIHPKDNKPDFYRGVFVSPGAVDYLKGLLALKDKSRPEQLRFYFDYLENADKEIAADARAEFYKASAADIANASVMFQAPVLRGWLSNDKTPPERLGLYALLLGYCGEENDAKLLRSVLEKHKKDTLSFLDCVYVGYTLLKPPEGWAAAHAAAGDPAQDFSRRHAVLKAARFFLVNKGRIDEQVILETFAVFVEQADIADLAVEYLRQAKCWSLTDRIFAAFTKKGYDTPLMRRCLMCYVLQCPDKAAAKCVAERRKADPELVREAEEVLKFEAN